MAQTLADEIVQKVPGVGGLYHRLLLVVGPSGIGKTAALQGAASRTGAPLVNVNLELSRRLLDLSERRRAFELPGILREVLEGCGSLALLDNIEILFDVSFQQDPLRLPQGLARNRTVVAAWNGTVDGQHVLYAAPGHPEYRRYPASDLVIVSPKPTA